DFVKKPYNPWKRYWIFTISGSVAGMILFLLLDFYESQPPNILMILALFIMPVTLAFIMVFGHRDYKNVLPKTFTAGMLASIMCYCITLIIFGLTHKKTIFSETLELFAAIIGVYFILFGLCWIIAFPILKIKQKKYRRSLPNLN
ncbi:MAG: hypothetical protein V4581_07100, partial [Bacteroidota bacterium]